jgi:hypothetical protein
MIPERLKKHPIWSKVVASVITAAILYGATFIPGLYGAVWNGIKAAAMWLIASTQVVNWLLIIMSILSLITVVGIAARLQLYSESPSVTTEEDYDEDRFWEVVWRWRYGRQGIYKVVSFCPKCDMQIYAEQEYGDMIYNKPDGSRFECDHCREFGTVIPVHISNLENTVVRRIQRKLRTGEWRAGVNKEAPSTDA